MGKRRLLVIGSQCDALKPPLSFLPDVAKGLYEVMVDPALGDCVPALLTGGLLVDPTVSQTKEALRSAFQLASANNNALLIAFIGHGHRRGNDFYLLPKDAGERIGSETAVHIVQQIKELYGDYSNIDGLVLLLDTCYSGVAAASAASAWIAELEGELRFEILTATADRRAAEGCFTRSLTEIIRNGLADVLGNTLRCEVLRKELEQRCPNQVPQHPTYNTDPGLYIARNAARRHRRGGVWERVEQLTEYFQPFPQLAEIVSMSRDERCLVVVGDAGTGKSSMAASLLRHEVTEGAVPPDFVHAVVFVGETTTSDGLARELRDQLEISVHWFSEATKKFESITTLEEKAQLNQLQALVLGPLRCREENSQVRIVFDGLDRLPSLAVVAVQSALDQLTSLPEFADVRLIVSSRPDTSLPPGSRAIPLHLATTEQTARYLNRRNISSNWHQRIIDRSKGNWLVTRLYADLILSSPDFDQEDFPEGLSGLYDLELRRVGASDKEKWRKELRPVLGVLAAAGVGPVLPFTLLCNASGRLGGPSRPSGVHDVLQDMRGLVVRGAPGTEEEHAGVFHQTFGEYLLDPRIGAFGADANEAHEAILQAIAELIPESLRDGPSRVVVDRNRPERQYAASAEAIHLWATGRYVESVKSLHKWDLIAPAENLALWRGWYDRVERTFGKDHHVTLRIRNNIAFWTGETGEARQAFELFKSLLPDQERVLGKNHVDTLTTRNNIASWTGKTGDKKQALELFEKLLPDQERVLGKNDPDTIRTRNNIASWTGKTGDKKQALELFEKLLPDQERVLGKNDPDTLTTRNNIAQCIGETGSATRALALIEKLLPDQERVLGKDHPLTLRTRSNFAFWTGEMGSATRALALYQELLPDRERVLGKQHPATLETRDHIASRTGKTGDKKQALELFERLLPDQERVLGKDHRDTLVTRDNIAFLTGETGDTRQALKLCKALLRDEERAFGKNHVKTFKTRRNIAFWTGMSGNTRKALNLCKRLVRDEETIFGKDDPRILGTRELIAILQRNRLGLINRPRK
jgi:Tetratricopeptide repeat/AAA ATPase domain